MPGDDEFVVCLSPGSAQYSVRATAGEGERLAALSAPISHGSAILPRSSPAGHDRRRSEPWNSPRKSALASLISYLPGIQSAFTSGLSVPRDRITACESTST